MSTKKERSLFREVAAGQLKEMDEFARLARENGFMGIALADDIAGKNGLLFSVDYFRRVVWPVYRDIAEIVKGRGLFAFLHSDGI